MATKIVRGIIPQTKAWHRFRRDGLGASDVGAARGKNKFHSRWKLWQEKVGIVIDKVALNAPMEHGSWQEDYVATCWRFYDGTMGVSEGKAVENYVLNMHRYRVALAEAEAEENRRESMTEEAIALLNPIASTNIRNYQVRGCRRLNGIVINDDYPWLYANLDRVINGDQFRLDGPGRTDSRSPLECKTILGFHAATYESGHPPYWHDQGFAQMLMMEAQYCEYAYLKDTSDFNVIAYGRDEEFMQGLIDETHSFWYDHVVPARELWEKLQNDTSISAAGQQEILEQIDAYMPDPDHSDPAWLEFLKERARDREETEEYIPEDTPHTQALLENARCDEMYRILAKQAAELRDVYSSKLATEMDLRDRSFMTLPDGWRVEFRALRAGQKPSVKVKPPKNEKPDTTKVLSWLGNATIEELY